MLFSPSEEAWRVLLSDDVLQQKREAAEKKYRDLTGKQIEGLRKLAKTNLYFLATGILGYDRLSENLHGHYAAWLNRNWGERYRMSLMPRDHYKTTINTICDSIQMALPNDANVQAHPYCLGPNIKILLAHENRESATRFLFAITQAFRSKPLMLALFPECIPNMNEHRVNKFELELPRDERHIEPTFDTIGAGGAAQGRHYHWLKLDDLVGEDARDSEVVMRRVLDWFDNVNSLLTRIKMDGWDLVGTRWSATDVYGHAIDVYGVNKTKSFLNVYTKEEIDKLPSGLLVVYARSAIENGQPIFPEEFSIEDLSVLRRNPRVWAAQYANNPREGGLTEFDPKWLKFYNIGKNGRIYVFAGENSWSVDISSLDRVIMVDPAVGESKTGDGDEWGFVVTGTDHKLNIYVLEAFRKRLKAPEGLDEMLRLYSKWNPRVISIEEVAFSAMLKYWFTEKCNQLRIYPSIYQYKPGSKKSKEARIRGLANYAAAGQIYIQEGMHQLRDEWEWFPIGESDHILDALAQGPEVWARGRLKSEMMEVQKAVETIMEERDALTGY